MMPSGKAGSHAPGRNGRAAAHSARHALLYVFCSRRLHTGSKSAEQKHSGCVSAGGTSGKAGSHAPGWYGKADAQSARHGFPYVFCSRRLHTGSKSCEQKHSGCVCAAAGGTSEPATSSAAAHTSTESFPISPLFSLSSLPLLSSAASVSLSLRERCCLS